MLEIFRVATLEGHHGEPVAGNSRHLRRAAVARLGELARGLLPLAFGERGRAQAERREGADALGLGPLEGGRRFNRPPGREEGGPERGLRATEKRRERRAPDPVAQRRLGARRIPDAQHEDRAVESRELRSRRARIGRDRPVEELLGFLAIGVAPDRELGGELERVGSERIARERLRELEELLAGVLEPVVTHQRPRETEPGGRGLGVARNLGDRAPEGGRGRHVVSGVVRGLAPQQERRHARVRRGRARDDRRKIARGLGVLAQLEIRLGQAIGRVPAGRAARLHPLRQLVLRPRFVAVAGEPIPLALQQEHVRADRVRERGAQEILRDRRHLGGLLRLDQRPRHADLKRHDQR